MGLDQQQLRSHQAFLELQKAAQACIFYKAVCGSLQWYKAALSFVMRGCFTENWGRDIYTYIMLFITVAAGWRSRCNLKGVIFDIPKK